MAIEARPAYIFRRSPGYDLEANDPIKEPEHFSTPEVAEKILKRRRLTNLGKGIVLTTVCSISLLAGVSAFGDNRWNKIEYLDDHNLAKDALGTTLVLMGTGVSQSVPNTFRKYNLIGKQMEAVTKIQKPDSE